jgi:hypothetical protein
VIPPTPTEPFCRFEIELFDPAQAEIVLASYRAGALMVNACVFFNAERHVRKMVRDARGGGR